MKNSFFDIRLQRTHLLLALEQLQAKMQGNSKPALLLADIRDFRRINAAFGFSTGDAVLHQVAERLRQLLPPRDTQVFRIGNDEFAVILPTVMHSKLLAVAADKAAQLFQTSLQIDERAIKVNINVGTAITEGQPPCNAEQLLFHAERSLAHARAQGITYVMEPDPPADSEAMDLAFEQALHEALSTHSLELYYQPKIDLFTRAAQDFEALIRWPHPTRGLLNPDVFLPVVERIGRFEELTKFVLHTALRHRNDWPVEEARVAINVPASIVHDRLLPDMVASALSIWGARASALTLEITEGAIIKDHIASQHHLAALKALGTRISIDDFGTGYSSLAYFKHLPASELKIDKSFVANLCNDADDRHLVQLIIDLAHHFGLKVVAEGVENADTLQALMNLNCDSVQGYFFAKPMPHEALIQWLEEYQPQQYFKTS